MGINTATQPDPATKSEFVLGWAAVGFIPGLVLILVWSYLGSLLGSGEKRDWPVECGAT